VTGPAGVRDGLEPALAAIEDVEGWLSDDQARRLWQRAQELSENASIVEIGSFRGRSTILLALAAPSGAVVTAIDPHAGGDRGPQEIRADSERGEQDNLSFAANLDAAGVADRVQHIRMQSDQALGSVSGPIDLLYVDGAHRYRAARDDITRWGARVGDGGVMLIHDGFSSVGVTLATLRLLVAGRNFAYAGRSRSLLEYRREELSGRTRFLNAARQLAELGWFARNLLVKLAIVLHARPVLRLLGQSSGEWPY
jgi:predicted O-methyltransferase YrrM